jgi:hypothetical protein
VNEFDPTDLHAIGAAKQAAEAQAKLAHEQSARDLSAVMATPAGRRVVLGLLTASGVFSSAPAGSPTVYEDGRREGRRDIGLALLEFLQGPCLGSYVMMLKEADENV